MSIWPSLERIRAMSEGERRRFVDGRYDWSDDLWQDHCGDAECAECDGEIPWGYEPHAEIAAELVADADHTG